MALTLALAGDTMLGRKVAEALEGQPPSSLIAPEVVEISRSADLFVLNLECCISERGERWLARGKPFFFRAPPVAVEVLTLLGVDCVTLANNHALDYGPDALLDTLSYLEDAGVDYVGAGPDLERARSPAVLDAAGTRVVVIGATDHPDDFAATESRPGVSLADFAHGAPEWLASAVRAHADEVSVVMPHWGPNMTSEPLPHIKTAADDLVAAGATLVAGHSAHVFHGVRLPVIYDLGDFLDDYAVDPLLRNDLGLLFLVTLDAGPIRLEGVPLKLDYCHTRLARGGDAAWIRDRLIDACAGMGADASWEDGRVVVTA